MSTHYRLLILLLVIVVAAACGQPGTTGQTGQTEQTEQTASEDTVEPAPAIETVIFSDLNWTSAQVQNRIA